MVVVGPDGPRPFMRGILVQSLASRGVPFETALDTANRVREKLGSGRRIDLEDLAELIERELPAHLLLEARPTPSLREPPRVRSRGGMRSHFSKGLLAGSLQGAGLDSGDAWDVAREVEGRLLARGVTEIDRGELRELARRALRSAHGDRVAENYGLMRAAREDGRPLLVLLGGAPGVGKTSLSVEVARRLEIARVMGTDSIRQIMRLMFSQDLMPELYGSTFDVHNVLPLEAGPGAPDPVLAGYLAQAHKIVVGVNALLDRAIEENSSLVIEGANLVPGMVDLERYRRNAHVIFVLVAAIDQSELGNRFRTRAEIARERGADRYLEHLDEIARIQEYLLGEADQRGLPIIDNVRFDEAVLSVIRSAASTLKKSVPLPVEADMRR